VAKFLLRTLEFAFYQLLICWVDRLSRLPRHSCPPDVKRALGKLRAPDDIQDRLRVQRFTDLPLHARHVMGLRGLPPRHRDPFDRMLVAQAITDSLVIITADERIRACPVRTLPA
jgi:hypothetical protein